MPAPRDPPPRPPPPPVITMPSVEIANMPPNNHDVGLPGPRTAMKPTEPSSMTTGSSRARMPAGTTRSGSGGSWPFRATDGQLSTGGPMVPERPYSRLTVLAPRRAVDVALPADVPVADLVPMVLELVGEPDPSSAWRPEPFRLSGVAGGP